MVVPILRDKDLQAVDRLLFHRDRLGDNRLAENTVFVIRRHPHAQLCAIVFYRNIVAFRVRAFNWLPFTVAVYLPDDDGITLCRAFTHKIIAGGKLIANGRRSGNGQILCLRNCLLYTSIRYGLRPVANMIM